MQAGKDDLSAGDELEYERWLYASNLTVGGKCCSIGVQTAAKRHVRAIRARVSLASAAKRLELELVELPVRCAHLH